MKKLFLFLSVLFTISATAQIGTTPEQSIGNANTLLRTKGYFISNKGVIYFNYTDTTAANATNADTFAGVVIRTGNTLWMRSHDRTRWISQSGGSSTSSTTVFNDSTLIICDQFGSCDTITFNSGGGTNIINNFFFSNDSTLIVCTALPPVCDSIIDPFTGLYIVNCTTSEDCDTLYLANTGLVFQNGIGLRGTNTVELGQRPLIKHTTLSGKNLYDLRIDSTNFYARGVFGSGQDVNVNLRPQMVFYSKKAAFMAGQNSQGLYTDDSIGAFTMNLGVNNLAIQPYSFISGVSNRSNGAINATFGNSNFNDASRGFIYGQENSLNANAYNSTVSGRYSHGRGQYTNTFGLGLQNYHYANTVIGMYNDTLSKANEADFASRIAGYRIFEVGNGTATGASRSNAMTILNDGRVGLGTVTPVSSSLLQMISTTKGFLPPVMTAAQMNAISSPATGLIVFCTDSTEHCYYTGSAWLRFSRGGAGIDLTTASSGLTKTGYNIALGGSALTGITTIPTSAFGFIMESSAGITFRATNSATGGIAVQGSASGTSSYGVSGVANNGTGSYGGLFSSAPGKGISATSQTGITGEFYSSPTVTNTVHNQIDLISESQGTVAAGFGTSIRFELENSSTRSTSNRLISKWADHTSGSTDSYFEVGGVTNGVEKTFLQIQGGGVIRTNDNADTVTNNSNLRTGTFELSNKRIIKRSPAITQSATPAINTDITDVASITGLAQAITSMTTNLTGTRYEGDELRIHITDNGTARAITWGSSFEDGAVTLPTTTIVNTKLWMQFFWNTATNKYAIMAKSY